ncbi:NACHT C-terminal alpha/beta 1 domain-containing protein [Scytonema sp. NUACC21]
MSETILNDLSKFDGAICVICGDCKNNSPLTFFRSSQPTEDVLAWINSFI